MSESVPCETHVAHFHGGVYGYHLPLPEDVAALFLERKDKRVVCTINGQHTMHAGLISAKKYWFILLNQDLVKKLQLSKGQEVSITLKADISKYGMEMPEELAEVLTQDVEADRYFSDLTPGKQRSLIYIVAKVKRTQSRINKALAIAEHLCEFHGAIDYKALNESIKRHNQMR